MLTRLRNFLSSFVQDDPFAAHVDYTPQPLERAPMAFHVCTQGKHRPRVVSNHATRQEAEFAAMDAAAGFSAAGWSVFRDPYMPGRWHIALEVAGDWLVDELEVLSTEQAIPEEVS